MTKSKTIPNAAAAGKRPKLLEVVAIVLALTLLFSACGGSGGTSASAGAGDAGYYVIDSITQGGETYDAESLKDMGINYYIILNEDGTMELHTDVVIQGTWKAGILSYKEDGEDVINEYALDKDTLTVESGDGITLVFERSAGTAPVSGSSDSSGESGMSGGEGLSEALEWWNGDWYGYWTAVSAAGEYESLYGGAWDCYAVIEVREDGAATVYLWDDEAELATADIQIDELGGGPMGGATSESGLAFTMELEHADWVMHPSAEQYENMIAFGGAASNDPEDFFASDTLDYEVYLRPWGMSWDDVPEDKRPPSHDDWYLENYNDSMMDALEESTLDGQPVFIHPAVSGGGTGGDDSDDTGTSESGTGGGAAESTLTSAELKEIYSKVSAAYDDFSLGTMTYEDVRDTYFGGVEGEPLDAGALVQYKWYAADISEHYVSVSFMEAGNGKLGSGVGSYLP